MSSKPSKRDKLRGFFKDTSHPSSDHFPPQSPTPSSSGAYSTKDVVSAVLKAALKSLRKSTGSIPVLKSFVDALADCVDNIPAAAKNHREYRDLTCSITTSVNRLKEHTGDVKHEQMVKVVGRVIEELDQQVRYINEKQGRTKARSYVEAEADIEDIIRCYRRIDSLLRQVEVSAYGLFEVSFTLKHLKSDAILNIWKLANENRSVVNETLTVSQFSALTGAIDCYDIGQIAKNASLEALNPAKMARYDSFATSQLGRGGCTPKTRQLVLEGLLDWANDPNSSKVYWMNGMAGTGKTTIAYSFCTKLEESDQLAASFFCSRSLPDCRDGHRIVPTLAYQLARFYRPLQDTLCRVLGDDPDIIVRNIGTQFEKLVSKPLIQLKDTMPAGLLVVVIDALDECTDPVVTSLVLDALLRFAKDIPIKFFVTCRPERGLLDLVSSPGEPSRSLYHLHDIERSLVQTDIETYLKVELGPFGTMADHIERLAELSGNLFIYAATAVRYIRAENAALDDQDRLEIVLGANEGSSCEAHAPLDTLYSTILSAALDKNGLKQAHKEKIKLVLDTVVCAKEPLTIEDIAQLLSFRSAKQVRQSIEPLRSVLHVDEHSGLTSTLHASFTDYVLSYTRSGHFSCHRAKHNELFARRCFETMNKMLRFNICKLESSYVLDKDVRDLPSRIEGSIPPHLFYACRYWSDHLVLAGESTMLSGYLVEFLRLRALFWVEVMNLKQSTRAGSAMLSEIYRWMKSSKVSEDLCLVCQDAQRFITVIGANPVGQSTPHIYVSVLALWNKSDPMWLYYGVRMRSLVQAKGPAIDSRESSVLAVWQAKSEVYSVSVSPDSRRVVSVHNHGMLCFWDAYTGDLVAGPLKGHVDATRSVGFSPDSSRVVSGSDDWSICIWSATTGYPVVGPFKAHNGEVWSVAYSPLGQRIASGSADRTIRIWDSQTGQRAQTSLYGHNEAVVSVAYSSDGSRIVSGSADWTVRIWDEKSGQQVIGPLNGHTGWVRSVRYSPDCSRIVSSSDDGTIRFWDSRTGDPVARPFSRHTGSVRSVTYSPDGKHIVSCSEDHTICILDAHNGRVVAGPLRGHTYGVYAAVFMPDGDRIISCSPDQTIRIWDAQTRHIRSSLSEGHIAPVRSVAFSPDGRRIVSGSNDRTVCVWDARTGSRKAGLFKGHTSYVNSVAFSPCDYHVASASGDRTIRVWDARAGSMLAGPFEGYTNKVYSLAFSPDGSYIASGSRDFTIRVWNSQTGQIIAGPFKGHTSSVFSVAYSPDGSRIASGSADQTVRIWDAQTGALTASSLESHTDTVYSVAYSPDSKHIVSGSYDCSVCICNAQTGAAVLGPLIGHIGKVISVAYSFHGLCIISGSDDHTIRVWDAVTGQSLAVPFQAHTGWVYSIASSPNGRFIASGSADHAIRVWDLTKCLATTSDNPEYWTMNESGWIVSHDSILLFWVPPDLRPMLIWPQNVAVIHQQGSFGLYFTNALIGPCWTKCYKSE
ncbi:hypothetical protein FRC07_011748 [Ceratobasidium sp. 392]|nr:hypothetical protein FRC07_011748 [Ceratobasidium sp. 392]